MSSYTTVPLRSLATRITKGTTPTTLGYSFLDQGVNYVKSESITEQGQIDTSKFAFIAPETHQALERSMLAEGDVLFSMAGVYLGKTAVVPDSILPANTNQAVGIVRLDQSKALPRFVHYALSSPSCRAIVRNGVAQSAQPNINLRDIGELRIPDFEIREQRHIADILGTLDDKIELNGRMNRTLEAIARAIFKSWFIDFDPVHAKAEGREPLGMDPETAALFPDSFHDSPLGKIPKGWEVAKIEDLGEVICGKTPRTAQPENYGSGIPFITIPDMREAVFVTRTARELTDIGAASQPKKLLPPNSVCVSCIATPGLVSLTSSPSHTNQQINSIVCKDGISPYWCYLQMQSMSQEVIAGGSGGSATLNLNKGQFGALRISLPPRSIQGVFQILLQPIFGSILLLAREVDSLECIRDSLLPPLLSGEIRLSGRTLGGDLSD